MSNLNVAIRQQYTINSVIDTVVGVVVSTQNRSVVHKSSRITNEVSAADGHICSVQSRNSHSVVEISREYSLTTEIVS